MSLSQMRPRLKDAKAPFLGHLLVGAGGGSIIRADQVKEVEFIQKVWNTYVWSIFKYTDISMLQEQIASMVPGEDISQPVVLWVKQVEVCSRGKQIYSSSNSKEEVQ